MTSSEITAEQRERFEELIAFWTPERLASAQPIGTSMGHAASKPAVPGNPVTTQIKNPATSGYYRRAGRLFVVLGGKPGYASACAINENGILTAAHVLYDRTSKSYATDGLFYPAYQDGGSVLGKWALEGTPSVPANWISDKEANSAWDYGFSRTDWGGKPLELEPLGKVTGFFRLVVDRSNPKSWDNLGYPATANKPYNFDGQKMWSCEGDYVHMDSFEEIGKEGVFTEGSSGGPWLVPKTEDVNGVTSYHYGVNPTVNYSPYFTSDVLALYKKTFGSD